MPLHIAIPPVTADIVGAEVWTMEYDATGPEGGDYDGLRSVHATMLGATAFLEEKLGQLNIPAGAIYNAHGGPDGFAGDFENASGWIVSFGIHRTKVRA